MCHHAKVRADRSNRYIHIVIFRFFNMAAVRHLGFLKVRNFVTKKTKTYKLKTTREWYLTHLPGCPTGAIALNFGIQDDITDLITHAKFCDNRFRGFGVLIPTILPFSIGIAGRPYKSVSSTVLHCDCRHAVVYTYSWHTANCWLFCIVFIVIITVRSAVLPQNPLALLVG